MPASADPDVDFANQFTRAGQPPPPPADVAARMTDLESLAASARTARNELSTSREVSSRLKADYIANRPVAEKGRFNEANAQAEVDYDNRLVAYYRQKAKQVLLDYDQATWQKTFATTKALVWDTFLEKVVMPEVKRLPHYDFAEKAQKTAAVGRSILDIETDAELLSTKAAEVLALGPPSDGAKLIEQVWFDLDYGSHKSIDAALDAIDAPPDLKSLWAKFLTSGSN